MINLENIHREIEVENLRTW